MVSPDPIQSSSGTQDRDFVTALARGLQVIQSFSADAPELTLKEVATRTGLSPATARRSLFTLRTLGYVRTHGRRFVLTVKVLSLGAAYLHSMNLPRLVQPFLQDLHDEFQDAASFTILEHNQAVYIAHVAIKRPISRRVNLGSRLPAHATSVGLALLSYATPETQQAFLSQAPFQRFTSKTPYEANQLKQLFELVRAQGYAVACETLEYGAVAVAVPVLDWSGRAVGAINCSADTTRVSEAELIATRVPRLRAVAAEMSSAFARYPALVHSVEL